jgi:predicted oxidoreductase (fatty acid repression mutant protein)
MKNQIKRAIALILLIAFNSTQAQVLDGLVKSAEKKVKDKVSKEVKKDTDEKQKKSKVVKKSSEFESANTVVFQEDFSKDKLGTFPASMITKWRSSRN